MMTSFTSMIGLVFKYLIMTDQKEKKSTIVWHMEEVFSNEGMTIHCEFSVKKTTRMSILYKKLL
jgi:hypothetical protein